MGEQDESQDEDVEAYLTSLALEADAVVAQWRVDADTAAAAANTAAAAERRREILARVRLHVRDLFCLMIGSYGPIFLAYLAVANMLHGRNAYDGHLLLMLLGYLGSTIGGVTAYLVVCFWGRQPLDERERRLLWDVVFMAVVDVIAVYLLPGSSSSPAQTGSRIADLIVCLGGCLVFEAFRYGLVHRVSVHCAPPVPTAYIPRQRRPE